MWENWVIDAGMGWPPCLCPIEGDLHGDFQVVTGMNFIGGPPPTGKIVAIIHPGGQDAVDTFYSEHKQEIDDLLAARR